VGRAAVAARDSNLLEVTQQESPGNESGLFLLDCY